MCVKGPLFYWGSIQGSSNKYYYYFIVSLAQGFGPGKRKQQWATEADRPRTDFSSRARKSFGAGLLAPSLTLLGLLMLPVGAGASWSGIQPSAVMGAGRQVGI